MFVYRLRAEEAAHILSAYQGVGVEFVHFMLSHNMPVTLNFQTELDWKLEMLSRGNFTYKTII